MGRAQLASISLIPGIGLLLIGFVLIFSPANTLAQSPEAEYEGARECRSCHGVMGREFAETAHSQTMVATNNEETPLLADFNIGEDTRTVQFPGSDTLRPFTADDVAYSLGTGVHVQRYLYEMEEGVYMLFPAEWNTVTDEWQAYDTGEEWLSESYNFNQNCSYCHVTGFEEETLEWNDEGVQCEACHGPGSEHITLIDELEFVENVEEREQLHESISIAIDPATCGQCHSQGTALDSAHPFPAGYTSGEDLSESWTLLSDDAEAAWHATGQAAFSNMQYNEWLISGHATSYESATESEYYKLECLSCHSSGYRRAVRLLEIGDEDPEALPIPEVEADRLPFGVTCSTCHNPHDDSAKAEDFDSLAAVYTQCTDCHQSAGEIAGLHHPVKEIFEGLPLIEEVEAVEGVHFSAEDGPTCTTCHMPIVPVGDGTRNSHVLTPISPSLAMNVEAVQDSCTTCHEPADGQSMQELIDSVQSNIQLRYETALETVDDDTPEWITNSLRVVENEGSWGIHNLNYSSALLSAVETELGLRETDTAPLILPQIEPQDSDAINEAENGKLKTVIFGLTMPALILISAMIGIIVFASVTFFRGGDA